MKIAEKFVLSWDGELFWQLLTFRPGTFNIKLTVLKNQKTPYTKENKIMITLCCTTFDYYMLM